MKRNALTIAMVALVLAFAGQTVLAQSAPANSELKPAQPVMAPSNSVAPAAPAAPAADGGTSSTSKPAQSQPESPFSPTVLIALAAAFVLMMFFSGRSKRKQEQKRKEMLNSLKKGDRVTSIGGIMGSVIEVRDDEVTVKVDETNNVRMKFARWAIRGVGEEAKTETSEDRK